MRQIRQQCSELERSTLVQSGQTIPISEDDNDRRRTVRCGVRLQRQLRLFAQIDNAPVN